MERVNLGFCPGGSERLAGRRIDQAIEFLHRELADGSRSSTDVQAAAKSAGIAERTLRRAREAAGIRVQKSATSWIWLLPEVGQEHGRHKNIDNLDTINETNNLLATSIFSQGEDGQKSEREHVPGHVEDQGKKKQNSKNKHGLISIVKGSSIPSPIPARFSLDQALDFIATASVKRQARATIKGAFEAAIPEVMVSRKINDEAALTWLMGRCCQYFEAVRATWPQDQWKYAKRPADFLEDKTWRDEPVIWDRSPQPTEQANRNGRNTSRRRGSLEDKQQELRRAIAAARANGSQPDGVLEPVSSIDGSNTERGSVSSLFPNRSQLAPNGRRSGVQRSGALAKILAEARGPDRADR